MTDQKNFFGKSSAKPKETWPVITFDQSLTIYFNNEAVKVLHYPSGHTDGDSIIYFMESIVVHMGNHFFSGMFPFVDLGSGGNVISFTENIGGILESLPEDVKIIPGHGPLSDRGGLARYHQLLKNSSSYVQEKIGNRINIGTNTG